MRVACPECRQWLEAPEPLPESAQCPFCGHVFSPATVLQPAEQPDAGSMQITMARDRVAAPAILTIILGAIWTIAVSISLLRLAIAGPRQPALQQLPADTPDWFKDAMRDAAKSEPVSLPVSAALALVVLFGGIQMYRLRTYPLALAASIILCIPCSCCCLGMPVGIWSLIVLWNPTVREAFRLVARGVPPMM